MQWTERERQALLLLAGGKRDKAIAREFGLGLKTTKGLIDKIRGKVGAETRAEAVAVALRTKVIE